MTEVERFLAMVILGEAVGSYGINTLSRAYRGVGFRYADRALQRLVNNEHRPNDRTLRKLLNGLELIERDWLVLRTMWDADGLHECRVCRRWFPGSARILYSCGRECRDLYYRAFRYWYEPGGKDYQRRKQAVSNLRPGARIDRSQRNWAIRHLLGVSRTRLEGPTTTKQVQRLLRIAELRGEPPLPCIVEAVARLTNTRALRYGARRENGHIVTAKGRIVHHGTLVAYQTYGCMCAPCRAVAIEDTKRRREGSLVGAS